MTERRRNGGSQRPRAGATRRSARGRAHRLLRPWILPLIRRRRRRKSRAHPVLGAAVYWGIVTGLWLVIGLIGVLGYFAAGLPDTGSLWRAKAGPSIIVVDAGGQTLATRGASSGDDLKLK